MSGNGRSSALKSAMALQRMMDGARRVAVAALGAGLLAACGTQVSTGQADAPALVVGAFDDSDALVAVLQDGSSSAAYVCGGPETFDSWTRWYTGPSGGGLVQDGWVLMVDAAGSAGTLVDPRGDAHRWQKYAGSADERDRLYSVVDSGCRTGAIVIGNGDEAVVQGVWCDEFGHFGQVTPVKPADADELILLAATPDGERRLVAERVRTAAAMAR